eukprot:3940521-Rhodomonas_salina.1
MTPFIRSAITCPVLFGNIEKASVVQVDESPVLMIVGCVRNIGEPALCLKRFRVKCIEPFACTGDAVESVNSFVESEVFDSTFAIVTVSKSRVLRTVQKSQLGEYTGLWYKEQCTLHALFRVLYDEDVVVPRSVEEQSEDGTWRELCESFTSELDALISTLE